MLNIELFAGILIGLATGILIVALREKTRYRKTKLPTIDQLPIQGFVLTASGKIIRSDRHEKPTFKDLALQMGRVTRYAGAIWMPLLTHSLIVAELAYRGEVPENQKTEKNTDPWVRIWAYALIHDCHEIISGEVPTAMKNDEFRKAQAQLDEWIYPEVFNLSSADELVERVKYYDYRALLCEAMSYDNRLPNFRDELMRDSPTGDIDMPTEAETHVAESIIASAWYDMHQTIRHDSEVIHAVAQSLKMISEGEYIRARANLLKLDRLLNRGEGLIDGRPDFFQDVDLDAILKG